MTTMLFLLSWLGILCLTGAEMERFYQTASACLNVASCNEIKMKCSSEESIFILRIERGYKPTGDACVTPSCGDCCSPGNNDCFSYYTSPQFAYVYEGQKCWGEKSCKSLAQQHNTGCPSNFKFATYATTNFSCLQGKEITDFYKKNSRTAPAVAIRYNQLHSGDYPITRPDRVRAWHCQVDTADCTQHQADVILVRESHRYGGRSGCSSVGWNGENLPCDHLLRYRTFSASTPFQLSVRVNKSARYPDAWAVVRAQDGSDLVVKCGYTKENGLPNISPCPETSSSPTTYLSLPNSLQGTSSSSTSVQPTLATTSASLATLSTRMTSSSQVLTSPSSATSSSQRGDADTAGSSNTAAIVGGVVAAVLVLVAAVMGIFCFLRRSRGQPKTGSKPRKTRKSSLPLTTTHSRNTSRLHTMASNDVDSSEPSEVPNPSLRVGPDGKASVEASGGAGNSGDYDIGEQTSKHGHAATSGTHDSGRGPGQDSDYDILGEKKTQSSKPATIYGRLGEVREGEEDTEYSYDHLARGPQSACDVIDSDYDTAALHVTTEGDYNVTFSPGGKQRIITGSDYDVAEVVSSGSSRRVVISADPSNPNKAGGANYEIAKPSVTSSGNADYEVARPVMVPAGDGEYSKAWE